MKLSELKNKKILILGFGVEGKATYEFLKKQFPKAVIGIADAEHDPHYLDKQKDYDIAIKSPGIHKSKVTIPYTTATNIFFANVKGITIGITGSKGKSTTAALIYNILKQAGKKAHLLGNITHKHTNLGSPLLSGLDMKKQSDNDIYVCELSSYQLDDLQYAPYIAVFTSFFPEHTDFHGSTEKYWEAKKNIVMFAKEDNFFVYNQDFPIIAKLAKKVKAKPLPFLEVLSFPDTIIPLIGKHNTDNVRAAVTVAKILGINDKDILPAIKNFKPLPHRLENIGTYKGITFYDDAIGTNPHATMFAIHSLPKIGTLFLGGSDKGLDFSEVAATIVEKKIPNLVLFPTTGEKIYEEIMHQAKKLKSRYQPNMLQTRSMEEAVAFAYKHSPKGTICLLSTASPSYSLWSGFEEKGNEFRKEVMQQGK